MSNQRPRSLRALAQEPQQERIQNLKAMLEVKILAADTQLLMVLRDPEGTEKDHMLWRARRRALIEVWEFLTGRVWHIPGAEI